MTEGNEEALRVSRSRFSDMDAGALSANESDATDGWM
jgi:hypothetical protein